MSLITTTTASVGIDVAKDQLDVVLRVAERALYQVFANTPVGFAALHAWVSSFGLTPGQVWVCLEATGSYSDAIALELFTLGYRLSVLNPAVLVEYRRSQQVRSKTDKLDAHLLARYAQDHPPVRTSPCPLN
jgi:transposase